MFPVHYFYIVNVQLGHFVKLSKTPVWRCSSHLMVVSLCRKPAINPLCWFSSAHLYYHIKASSEGGHTVTP